MKNFKITRNPFLLFLPFLFLYVVFVLMLYSPANRGDESKYIHYANTLLHSLFSRSSADVFLPSGPGYPIMIIPFLALHIPKVCIILVNPILHYLSIVFLYKALIQFVSFKKVLIFSLFWACYYIAYQNMYSVTTETFTIFLISLLVFFLVKVFNQPGFKETKKYIFISGFIFGYIGLTKVIFGPIILVMIIGSFFLWITNRKVVNYRKGVLILLIALATFAPYVIYTYNITGRIFYLGTGSDNLYWMSTPYPGEYGDWKGPLTLNPVDYGNYNIPGAGDTLIAHHQKDYDEVYKFKGGLERDDAFRDIAVYNIKSHPAKYAQNVFFNIGRIIFHYPFSYAVQRPKPLYVMPLNGILLTFMIICLIPTLIKWKKIMFMVRYILFIALLYLGASSLVSAETRMFTIIVPILLFWFAYIIQKSVKINLKDW